MSVVDITTKSQFDTLLQSTPYIALQAHATWCGPCKAISPFFKKHADELTIPDKYVFTRFDIDDVPDLASELGISSIPAFFFFENGDKSSSVVGAKPPVLKKALDDLADKAKGGNAPAAAEEETKKDDAVSA